MSNWLEQSKQALPPPNIEWVKECFPDAMITQHDDEVTVITARTSSNPIFLNDWRIRNG